jgi:hypothetical protein
MEVTRRPQDWSTTPMLLAVTPLPSPLTTPPVTRTYFMASIGFLSAASHSCLISRIRSLLGLGGRRLFLDSGGETEEVGENGIFFLVWVGVMKGGKGLNRQTLDGRGEPAASISLAEEIY